MSKLFSENPMDSQPCNQQFGMLLQFLIFQLNVVCFTQSTLAKLFRTLWHVPAQRGRQNILIYGLDLQLSNLLGRLLPANITEKL